MNNAQLPKWLGRYAFSIFITARKGVIGVTDSQKTTGVYCPVVSQPSRADCTAGLKPLGQNHGEAE